MERLEKESAEPINGETDAALYEGEASIARGEVLTLEESDEELRLVVEAEDCLMRGDPRKRRTLDDLRRHIAKRAL